MNNEVRAKVIAVSLGTGRSGKLGLTMRQKYLGKYDWIEADVEEEYASKEEKKSTKTDEEGEIEE
ncbi:unnamed protein product [marine sediment metagenome]|uniref:Uncharacterized protein n=1 Tax=marine sediment metagenome TaxID=412755 RepID=X1HYT2_9ZZZZ